MKFARVVQIEKRGAVIGDPTAGSGMEAKRYAYSQGLHKAGSYDFSVTKADYVMAVGKSIEVWVSLPMRPSCPQQPDLWAEGDPAPLGRTNSPVSTLMPRERGRCVRSNGRASDRAAKG